MKTWQELEVDEKYKTVFPYTEDHLLAMEDLATKDGEILHPLVVWNNTLIFGYPYLEILKCQGAPKPSHPRAHQNQPL